MRERCGRGARLLALAALATLSCGCYVSNLSYAEVERDLDALVEVEGTEGSERLVYRETAEVSTWYARATLLVPLRPLLIWTFGGTSLRDIDRPSEAVRELMVELAPKSGADPLRVAASMQRIVRIAELDTSPLNRMLALEALADLASACELPVAAGITEAIATRPGELPAALEDFRSLRPAGRTPPNAPLSPALATRYRAALQALVAVPLASWQQRIGLVADLATALREERVAELGDATAAALEAAFTHTVRWTLVRALQGSDPNWVEVRRCAMDILHRLGGPDTVPLLLALLTMDPQRTTQRDAAQTVQIGGVLYERHPLILLRLIHLSGQLDVERARRSVQLPGRESWQAIAPIDFLAQLALVKDDPFQELRIPATEALALCIRRGRLGLGEAEPGLPVQPSADLDWVRSWYDEYRRSS